MQQISVTFLSFFWSQAICEYTHIHHQQSFLLLPLDICIIKAICWYLKLIGVWATLTPCIKHVGGTQMPVRKETRTVSRTTKETVCLYSRLVRTWSFYYIAKIFSREYPSSKLGWRGLHSTQRRLGYSTLCWWYQLSPAKAHSMAYLVSPNPTSGRSNPSSVNSAFYSSKADTFK